MSDFHIEVFPVGLFQCNCVIIFHPTQKSAILVDPGDESTKIMDRILHHDVWVSHIWHTHAHLDHIGGTKAVFESLVEQNKKHAKDPPQLCLHEEDKWLYDNVALQSKFLGLPAFEITAVNSWVKAGQKVEGFEGVSSLHTPGHTPGSCCLRVNHGCQLDVPNSFKVSKDSSAPRVLVSGDTLFRRGIGRTDLWGGDMGLITKSIQKQLYTLPKDSVVIPGHGPLTVIEQEQEKNPFVTLS